ncbi:MAG: hypothetical protein R3B09_05680 [Nannocystaceae bacterium]
MSLLVRGRLKLGEIPRRCSTLRRWALFIGAPLSECSHTDILDRSFVMQASSIIVAAILPHSRRGPGGDDHPAPDVDDEVEVIERPLVVLRRYVMSHERT